MIYNHNFIVSTNNRNICDLGPIDTIDLPAFHGKLLRTQTELYCTHFPSNYIYLHSLNCPIMQFFLLWQCVQPTDIISILVCNCPKRHTSQQCLQTWISSAIARSNRKKRTRRLKIVKTRAGARNNLLFVPILSNVYAMKLKCSAEHATRKKITLTNS